MSRAQGTVMVLELESPLPEDHALWKGLEDAGLWGQQVEARWATLVRVPLPLPLDGPGLEAWRGPGVRRVFQQRDSFVLAGRAWQSWNTVLEARGHRLGGGELQLIAGPCSVESRQQMLETAHAVAEAGAGWLRGGAYKPRTSPYQFQGLGDRGLDFLRQAADAAGLAVISEVLDVRDLPLMRERCDVIQVGSRNAQNLPLLKELGRCGLPVLLKRGFGCTVEETVLAAEYVMSHGNPHVALCERGIRSFETATRFTFDVNALPWLKGHCHLPIVADPSHATGQAALVPAVALAAVAAGADALMLEVHPSPSRSASDADQALSLEEFARVAKRARSLSLHLAQGEE
jgi:3-deoxy-7-phosphoheptulonate synthase